MILLISFAVCWATGNNNKRGTGNPWHPDSEDSKYKLGIKSLRIRSIELKKKLSVPVPVLLLAIPTEFFAVLSKLYYT
jgi:hypothetical protein